MSMITESEKIAVCAVLGVAGIIDGRTFEEMLSSHLPFVREQAIQARDAIDELVNYQKMKARDAEFAVADLRYQLKELLLRIEERRDIRNDLLYKDLKRELDVA